MVILGLVATVFLKEKLLGSCTFLMLRRRAALWGQSVTGSIFSTICQEYFKQPIFVCAGLCKWTAPPLVRGKPGALSGCSGFYVKCCESALQPPFKWDLVEDGGRVFPGCESQGSTLSVTQKQSRGGSCRGGGGEFWVWGRYISSPNIKSWRLLQHPWGNMLAFPISELPYARSINHWADSFSLNQARTAFVIHLSER